MVLKSYSTLSYSRSNEKKKCWSSWRARLKKNIHLAADQKVLFFGGWSKMFFYVHDTFHTLCLGVWVSQGFTEGSCLVK